MGIFDLRTLHLSSRPSISTASACKDLHRSLCYIPPFVVYVQRPSSLTHVVTLLMPLPIEGVDLRITICMLIQF